MRAVQIVDISGSGVVVKDNVPEPPLQHPLSGVAGITIENPQFVLIDVKFAAVSFPDILYSRGSYQLKPPLPFTLGGEVSGIVIQSSDPRFVNGDRVAAMTLIGGMAERAVAHANFTFKLNPALDFAEGAALVGSYHTALFALKHRGRLKPGERVIVHGAAGGVGTATLQVAKALGATTIALVSSSAKERIASQAGADHVIRTDISWPQEIRKIWKEGADLIIDPVGGNRMIDSLRTLREEGRHVVVGFTAGSIPEVKVNRLLLNNLDLVGALYGAYVGTRPSVSAAIADELDGFIEQGAVRPILGGRLRLDQVREALRRIESRSTVGKIVLEI